MTTAKDLVDAIQSGKSATIQATFNSLMTEKIQDGIEAYRQAVIDNTFNPELVSESLDEGIFDRFKSSNQKVDAADAAFDDGNGKKFASEMDKRITSDLKAGKKIAQVRNPAKFGITKAEISKLHPYHVKQMKESELDEELQLEDYSLDEIQEFMMSEEFESLDELSKKTLGDYVNKATSGLKGAATQGFMAGANQGKNAKVSDNAYGTAVKRIGGIRNAVSRLTKESEEVSELSKKTLASYTKNAAISAVVGKEKADASTGAMNQRLSSGDARGAEYHASKANSANRKVGKRIVGIVKASDKLAKD